MRFLVALLLIGSAAQAMDMVAQDVLAEKTMDRVMEPYSADLMGEIIGLVPSNKYISEMGMLSAFTGCLSKAGSSMDKARANIGTAFKNKLTPLYNKVMKKVKEMKNAKKDNTAILNQGFKIATAGLTKPLVQSVVNVCMTKSTKAEYDCSTPPLNTIMQTSNYNMVYDAKRG